MLEDRGVLDDAIVEFKNLMLTALLAKDQIPYSVTNSIKEAKDNKGRPFLITRDTNWATLNNKTEGAYDDADDPTKVWKIFVSFFVFVLNLLNIKGQITRNRQKIMNNIHSLLSIFFVFYKMSNYEIYLPQLIEILLNFYFKFLN